MPRAIIIFAFGITKLSEMKLHKMSRVGAAKETLDSVKRSKQTSPDDRSRALSILLEAQTYYQAAARFRNERERNKRYTYGEQWSDVITVNGEDITEKEYIKRQGNVPLSNNLIRRLVNNIVGLYHNQSSEPTCLARDRDEQKYGEVLSTLLQYNGQLNSLDQLYARGLEEFLISGFVVHRKCYSYRNDKMDCWTDVVQPNNFFIDTNMRDFRGWDCTMVGEIHDVDWKELCQQFAKSPSDVNRLSEIYRIAKDRGAMTQVWEDFGYSNNCQCYDFLSPKDESLCRVIEIWRKENKPRYLCHDWNNGTLFKIEESEKASIDEENMRRRLEGASMGMSASDIPLIEMEWILDSYWYFYYLSPQGDILAEGETPYEHKSHPYVFKAYPFIDGEIHSFVSDVIDQQRYTNRLITLYDWIMRASAKGVLLLPEDCLPDGTSPEDFAETWSKFNGVILYKPSKHGNIPQQISNNSTNIGIGELLNLQLKLFEDISGVNGALQGKPGYSSTSGTLYLQQTQNATTSLIDKLNTYASFIRDAAYKDAKNIQQFYDPAKIRNIVGMSAELPNDPGRVKDLEFDVSMVMSAQTPIYRAMMNDFLLQIWQSGQINLEQMLKYGNFPFADDLLQSIQSQQEQMQQGQPTSISPELVEKIQEGADMNSVKKLHKALKA